MDTQYLSVIVEAGKSLCIIHKHCFEQIYQKEYNKETPNKHLKYKKQEQTVNKKAIESRQTKAQRN